MKSTTFILLPCDEPRLEEVVCQEVPCASLEHGTSTEGSSWG